MLRRLLRLGAAVDMRDRRGETALMRAAHLPSVAAVRLLLGHGADPNAVGRRDWSAMTCAADRIGREGESAATAGLLEALEAAGGRIELAEAVALGDVARARRLLAADPAFPIDHCTRHGWDETYLMDAVKLGHGPMVRFLLDRGASVRTSPDLGRTALLVAAERGDVATAAMLIDHAPDLDRTDWTGITCLAAAAAAGHRALVDLLLARGARPDLLYATLVGDERLVRDLLGGGSDPGRYGYDDGKPLDVAVRAGQAGIVAALLEHGARAGGDIWSSERRRDPPLAVAAGRGDLTIVHLLIDRGAPVAEVAADGTTALDRAEGGGHTTVAACLAGFRPEPLEALGPLTFAQVEHDGRRHAIDPPLTLVPSPRCRSRHHHILVEDSLGIEVEAVDRGDLVAKLAALVVGRREWYRNTADSVREFNEFFSCFPLALRQEQWLARRRWIARVRPLDLPA